MKTALFWAFGLAASLGAHAALFAFLALATKPAPLEAQPQASGKIKMTSYEVPQSKAAPQDTKGESQNAETANGQAAAQGPVRSQTAPAQPLNQPLQAPESTTGNRSTPLPTDNTRLAEIINDTVVEPASTNGAPIPALRAEGALAKARPAPTEPLSAKAAPATTAARRPDMPALAASPAPPPVAARAPTPAARAGLPLTQPAQTAIQNTATPAIPAPLPDTVLAVITALSDPVGTTAPNPAPVAASPLVSINAALVSADTQARTAKAPPATAAAARAPAAPRASATPLNALVVSAATGWSGTATSFDPASLAAVQSFMRPLDTATGPSARDGIAEILAQVPCSRLAATFIPETGTLELRGHVPDAALREPLLNAVRAQLGASIPVGGSMVVLPSPQCDVLSQLDNLGLPQSTKQFDDPKQMGANVQLTTFNYSDGDLVTIKMKSYDFAAYVYVDYFDVDGRVLHLRPNQWEPLQYYQPGSDIVIGETADGQPTINLTVAPPFGRELAVAYASSVPLYEGLRATIEPAGPYLDYLRTRIAELKAENPDYKGDWVYMFIETGP